MNLKMENIGRLSEIAEFVGAKDLLAELNAIRLRVSQPNAELIFPLVGEFSSGKTTLINALTDCKKLETATKPTTATIYEVFFGRDKCYATVYDAKGEKSEVADIASLKNDELADAAVVQIFDTSKRIPSTTVLVDTPGLSSTDPKHRQTLVSFLPKADGIFLVTDINQQITRSLTDFIETMKLSKRPIYLVITKCDSKSPSEVEAAKQYISDNCKLPLKQMACVSASKDDMAELYDLLAQIQKDKNSILEQANKQRLKNIAVELQLRIEELLKASNSDKELDEAIRNQELELNRLKRSIERLIDDSRMEIEDCARSVTRRFEDAVSSKLETLVSGASSNYDAEAVGLINSISSLMLGEFKSEVKEVLRRTASNFKGSENELNLRAFTDVDMSNYSISGISYNMNLNKEGHEYDSAIATGVTIVGTVAAVAATAGLAAPAAGAAAAGTAAAEGAAVAEGVAVARGALSLDTIFDVADTVTDVASMNSKGNKGLVESMVGFVTERTMAKPQRRRAINNYMDCTLMPQFRAEIERISHMLLNSISDSLNKEAENSVNLKSDALNKLKKQRAEKEADFKNHMNQLKDFKNILITL